MRIDVYFTPQQTDELTLRDKSVVVIDVLRASTTIIAALGNGAREVIPVATVESAVKISGSLSGDVILLGGERNGKMVEGFNLGNSPAEYTGERVKGKVVIFSTTNGSQAMVKAHYARELFICGFVNISTVAETLRQNPRDFIIICGGNNGGFSLEDSVCAGMLIGKVVGEEGEGQMLSDGALAGRALYRTYGRGILKMMRSSEHGRYLEEIGFGDDLKVCAGIDTLSFLPQLDGNVIKVRREPEKKDEHSVNT